MPKDFLILAAGMGRRFGGLKQLTPVGPHGEAILDYTVFDALRAGFNRVVLVIRREIETPIRDHVASGLGRHVDVAYAFQDLDSGQDSKARDREKPWGTAHAVLSAADILDGRFAVANADDLYGSQAIAQIGAFLDRAPSGDLPMWSLIGFRATETLPPSGGGVSRSVLETSGGLLQSIDEIEAMERHPDGATWHDAKGRNTVPGDTLVSMNLWGFTNHILPVIDRHFLDFLARDPTPDQEILLPIVVGHAIDHSQARVRVLPTESQWCGITSASDRHWVRTTIRTRVEAGVYPKRLWS